MVIHIVPGTAWTITPTTKANARELAGFYRELYQHAEVQAVYINGCNMPGYVVEHWGARGGAK